MVTLGDPYLQDISYTYDKASNIKSVTDAAHSGASSCGLSNIQYDDLYRLVSLSSASEGRTITYEYDALGNLHKNGEMGAGAYTYHATKVHAVTAANGNSYAYDAGGNMTTRNSSTYGNQTLTYDEQNRLEQVAISGGSTVQFGYSAGGVRLWKRVDGQMTGLWIGSLYEEKDGKILCHVYAGDRLVATFEPESALACIVQNNRYLAALWDTGDWAVTAFFGGGRVLVTVLWAAALTGIALGLRYNRRRLRERYGLHTYYGLRAIGGTDPWRQMVLLTMAAAVFLSSNPQAAYADTPTYDPAFYYYHPDHLGSAQVMTDRNGELVQHYGYTPFGEENYQNNSYAFEVSSRYTGQTLDEDTGLYYYGARYYDPELARFIQPDSVVPEPDHSEAFNRYSYCRNNPLKHIDPGGNLYVPLASDIVSHSGWRNTYVGGVIGHVNFPAGVTQMMSAVMGMRTSVVGAVRRFPAEAQGLSERLSGARQAGGEAIAAGYAIPVYGSVKRAREAYQEGRHAEYALNVAWATFEVATIGSALLRAGAADLAGGARAVSVASAYETSSSFDAAALWGKRLRAGRPGTTGIGYSSTTFRTNEQLVHEIASRSNAWAARKGLTGTPQDLGIAQHMYAKRMLRYYQGMYGHRGLSTEVRYVNQRPWLRNIGMPTRGSVILDVVDGPLDNPVAIYDYKFGAAGLSPGRVNQIRNVTGFEKIPIKETRP